MSAKLNQYAALIAQQAAVAEDMNEAQAGGGSRLLPETRAFGRIVEYIDLGSQPQTYNGEKKDPAKEFRLGIALWGEGISNEDGSPYILRPFAMKVSRNEKANTFKAFAALNYAHDPAIKHFAQFVGQAFIFSLGRHKSKAGKESSIIKWDATAPAIDIMSGQPYAVPQVPDELYRVFLWDFPTLEAWSELYVEGTYDDGSSKNFLQETIVGALDFEGSPLDQLLRQSNIAAPAAAQPAEAAVPATPDATPTQPAQVAQVAAPAAVAAPAQQVAVPLDPTTPAPNAATTPPAVTAPSVGVPPAVAAPAQAAPTQQAAPPTVATSPSNPPAGLPALPTL